MPKNIFNFKGKVWLYDGFAAWHFVTLPKKDSKIIKNRFEFLKKGWGSLPCIITIGKTSWKTSIFPDKKSNAYLLPLKSDIRKKENIKAGDNVDYSVEILIDSK